MDWKELGGELSRACPGWEAAPEERRLVLTQGPYRVEVYGDTVSLFCEARLWTRSPGTGWRTFLLPAAHCHPESEAEVREAAAWYLENAAPLGEKALRRRARRQILLGVLAVALGILLGLLGLLRLP